MADLTPEEAYRRGQDDMRRRIAARWRGYYVRGIGSAVAEHDPSSKAAKHASVPVLIRSTKIKPLPAPPA